MLEAVCGRAAWRRMQSILLLPTGSQGVDGPCSAGLINELPCRAQLLCCQHLRDGNLLMLLATRISIRAPFMWSPRFTWIWNAANKPHLLQPLESDPCSLLLAFIHPAGSCMPTAPSWNWAELDYRRDQRPQHGSSPVFLAFSPPLSSCLTAGRKGGWSWL